MCQVPGTVSLKDDWARGDDSKQNSCYNFDVSPYRTLIHPYVDKLSVMSLVHASHPHCPEF